jgi:hypothetical protein
MELIESNTAASRQSNGIVGIEHSKQACQLPSKWNGRIEHSKQACQANGMVESSIANKLVKQMEWSNRAQQTSLSSKWNGRIEHKSSPMA